MLIRRLHSNQQHKMVVFFLFYLNRNVTIRTRRMTPLKLQTRAIISIVVLDFVFAIVVEDGTGGVFNSIVVANLCSTLVLVSSLVEYSVVKFVECTLNFTRANNSDAAGSSVVVAVVVVVVVVVVVAVRFVYTITERSLYISNAYFPHGKINQFSLSFFFFF